MLPSSIGGAKQEPRTAADLSSVLHAGDLWLTPKSVDGFDPVEFADWPKKQREELAKVVRAFLAVAKKIPTTKPAPKAVSGEARKYLERAIQIVRQQLLHEWLEAQKKMVEEATAAAKKAGWHVEKDEKELLESLLGTYKSPRLRIRTRDQEVVLDPIARFGSGRQGVVDLVVMPTYETMYLVTFKNGQWQIVSPRGTLHRRPFNETTLVNTITQISHR